MVIECAFGRLKARFGALRRPMDLNIRDLPYVIYACFVLHNFCEEHNETVGEELIAATCAGAANMPSWLIKTLGRWTSDCYQQYIKVPVVTLCHASKLLATSPAQPITG